MGHPPSELDEFAAADIDLLTRYWNEEPWGPYRDNLHAALIAREVRRTAFKGDHQLKSFMVRREKTDTDQGKIGSNRDTVFGIFKALAGGIKRKATK